jgi:hypothetical protein
MPKTPLGGERLPGSNFDLGRRAGDGGKLLFRQVGEERNRRNPGALDTPPRGFEPRFPP